MSENKDQDGCLDMLFIAVFIIIAIVVIRAYIQQFNAFQDRVKKLEQTTQKP